MRKPWRTLSLLFALLAAAGGQAWGQTGATAPQPADVPALAETLLNVARLGAVGDGTTKNTRAIQKAIDAAHDAGGGVVYFPPGVYLSGALSLKSNVTIYLETGATLLGSADLADYPKTIPEQRSYTDNYVYQSLLYGENVHDVALEGRGTIDGQGADFPRKHPTRPYGERPYLIRLVSSQRIRVAGITLRNSPMWVQHYLACDDVVLDGVTVHSLVNANNDGIDIDGCHDVRISNCSIVSGDDAIVLKSTLDRACKNVAIVNCVLSTRCNALKLGTESNGGFENITISNCALYDVRLAGIALEMVDGGSLDGVVVSNIVMDQVGGAIFLRLGNRARPFQENGPKPGMGRFRNVVISNVIAAVSQPIGCAIAGLPGHPIENVSLSNIKLTFPGEGAKELVDREVPENETGYPEYKMFGALPGYGFYCRHVDGISMSDVDLRWAKPDSRPALVCDDVRNLQLAGFRAEGLPDGPPLIVLRDTHGAMVRGCAAPRGIGVFLRLEGETDRIHVTGNDLSGAAAAFQFGPGLPVSVLYQSANATGR